MSTFGAWHKELRERRSPYQLHGGLVFTLPEDPLPLAAQTFAPLGQGGRRRLPFPLSVEFELALEAGKFVLLALRFVSRLLPEPALFGGICGVGGIRPRDDLVQFR